MECSRLSGCLLGAGLVWMLTATVGCSQVTEVAPDDATTRDRTVAWVDAGAMDSTAMGSDALDSRAMDSSTMDARMTDAGPCFGAPGRACSVPGEVCAGPVFMCFGPPWNGSRVGIHRCTCVDASFECGDPCAP